ncbi:hypothetical protein I6E74_01805 [Salinibacterium sp. SWN139]|uniref:hypothetical protein n=1 Tax=Salinibacterium sp. SWN139 TaxID=2792055 RepID=UPI0018CFA5CD|nr:hypothetical protein [Salinibacterium sp. SWN139]MBH0052902.1 hypothetical protein [Salinibacterium sp. SWN139]
MSEQLRPVQVSIAAASAALIVLALTGCVQSETDAAVDSATEPSLAPSSAPTEPTAEPTPVVEQLVIPECSTMVPLDVAKSSFSESTVLLAEENFLDVNEWSMPEEAAAISNASVAKDCWWGVPRGDGFFGLAVIDIDSTHRATLASALLDEGAVETALGSVTVLNVLTLSGLNDIYDTHYFADDVWIHGTANSDRLSTKLADAALEQIRVANPTRAY